MKKTTAITNYVEESVCGCTVSVRLIKWAWAPPSPHVLTQTTWSPLTHTCVWSSLDIKEISGGLGTMYVVSWATKWTCRGSCQGVMPAWWTNISAYKVPLLRVFLGRETLTILGERDIGKKIKWVCTQINMFKTQWHNLVFNGLTLMDSCYKGLRDMVETIA